MSQTVATRLFGDELDAGGQVVGSLADLYFDDATWSVRYLVLRTGSRLHHRKVLLGPDTVRRRDATSHSIDLAVGLGDVAGAPEADADMPVSRRCELRYRNYAAWPLIWISGFAEPQGMFAYARPELLERNLLRGDHGDPHLRSARHVIGHHLMARDGELGRVNDFVVDDERWIVRDLVLKSRHWWHAERRELSTYWVRSVNWATSTVFIDLTSERVRRLPSQDAGASSV